MVIHYNPFILKYLPEKYVSNYSEFLHSDFINFRKDYVQKTDCISDWIYKAFQSFIDRTNSSENLVKVVNLYPHVEYDNFFVKSFEDLCLQRAKTLLEENRKINVYWSGGLDSTAVLFTFLQTRKNKDQIHVIMNYNSILESGYVFDTFIKDNFNFTIETVRLGKIHFNSDEIYLTGHPADQISYVNAKNTNLMLINREEMKSSSSYENHIDEKTFSFFEKSLEKFPKKIKTVSDFLWFAGFNYRWQNACLAPFHIIANNNLKENYRSVVRGFYDNEDFQKWSMCNTEKDPEDRDSKIYEKKLIRKFAGPEIEDYVKHKKRTPSVYVNYDRKYLLTTDKFENIYITDDIFSEVLKERDKRG